MGLLNCSWGHGRGYNGPCEGSVRPPEVFEILQEGKKTQLEVVLLGLEEVQYILEELQGAFEDPQ